MKEYKFNESDTRSNIDKIKSIFFDYAEGISYLEIKLEDLDIIAKRIEIEVMNIQDDNEFVGLKDLNKKL
jgi:hypothetical protein